jgi:hypothetical protein
MATIGSVGALISERVPKPISTDYEPEYYGSRMIFQQEFAPTGWTRDGGSSDCGLRISNGTIFNPGPGNPFSSSYPGTNVTFGEWTDTQPTAITINPHVTTVAEMQSHTHLLYTTALPSTSTSAGPTSTWFTISGSTVVVYFTSAANPVSFSLNNAGSPAPAGHTHTISGGTFTQTFPTNINMNIKYVLCIVATR